MKLLETEPPSRKTNSFQGAQKQISFAWQKTEIEYASWKKCEELSESSFPNCVLFFLAFWVVVVVLLSHVSTQPQTETHYYVKYNMQTQNLKPYNLKIQHMENVNGRCGVRSCFHLLLPAVDAQKKKKKALFMCHPYTETISKEPSCVPSQATVCFIQQPFKAQLQQCEEMNLKNFIEIVLLFLWTWIQTHRHPSCIYCQLVTTAYSLCEMGAKPG